MEGTNGTLGVSPDNISGEIKTYNGIDAHMAKNTEWGSIALLAVSSYGAETASEAKNTTTGNLTGIYNMGNGTWEWTTGIWNNITSSTCKNNTEGIRNASSKYKEIYSGANSQYKGDALGFGSLSGWGFGDSNPIVCRGHNSLFDWGPTTGYNNDSANAKSNITSRVIVVMGSGL